MNRNQPNEMQHKMLQPVLDDDEDSNGSYDSNEDEDEEIPWIMWFCSLKGNEFFCEVDEEFIQDEFNLTGLASMVPFYDHAIDMILDLESPGEEDLTEEQQHMVESAAETLYGLIHARFITTHRGLKLMEDKYRQFHFGRCPRVFCGGQAVLPVGQSDVVRESSIKVFCPKCEDIYYPRSSRHKSLDGAFWGTTFPHLLLLQMQESSPPMTKSKQQYVPRIFGFRVRRKDTEGAASALTASPPSASSPVAPQNPSPPPPPMQEAGPAQGSAGARGGAPAGLGSAAAKPAKETVATGASTPPPRPASAFH
jgi:casein kinase II subunit beta